MTSTQPTVLKEIVLASLTLLLWGTSVDRCKSPFWECLATFSQHPPSIDRCHRCAGWCQLSQGPMKSDPIYEESCKSADEKGLETIHSLDGNCSGSTHHTPVGHQCRLLQVPGPGFDSEHQGATHTANLGGKHMLHLSGHQDRLLQVPILGLYPDH